MLSPVKLGRPQEALVSILQAALGSGVNVLWSDQQVPRTALALPDGTPKDLLVINPIDGPSDPDSQGTDEKRTLLLPDVVTLTVANSAAGVLYGVRLNGILYQHEATGADDDAVRDALVALIAADEQGVDGGIEDQHTTTEATGNPGEFTVTPDEVGGLWSLAAFPAADLTYVEGTQAAAQAVMGSRLISCSIQAYSHNRSYRAGAGDIAAKCRSALRLNSSRPIFDRHDVTMQGTPSASINLTALAGPEFETRSQFTVVVGVRSVAVEAIDIIENVNVGFQGRDPDASIQIAVSTP